MLSDAKYPPLAQCLGILEKEAWGHEHVKITVYFLAGFPRVALILPTLILFP